MKVYAIVRVNVEDPKDSTHEGIVSTCYRAIEVSKGLIAKEFHDCFCYEIQEYEVDDLSISRGKTVSTLSRNLTSIKEVTIRDGSVWECNYNFIPPTLSTAGRF